MRSIKEATVFGSLLMACANSRCVMPSFSSKVRITVNWSGVIRRCAMRRRKALFNPYQARRSNKGAGGVRANQSPARNRHGIASQAYV